MFRWIKHWHICALVGVRCVKYFLEYIVHCINILPCFLSLTLANISTVDVLWRSRRRPGAPKPLAPLAPPHWQLFLEGAGASQLLASYYSENSAANALVQGSGTGWTGAK